MEQSDSVIETSYRKMNREAESILESMRAEYNEAKQSMERLSSSGFLSPEEFETASSRLDETFREAVHAVENYTSINVSLAAPLPPPIDRRNLRGIIAFRQWKWHEGNMGKLSPLFQGMRESWKPIMYSDCCPTPDNSNGLYARSLIPEVHGYDYSFIKAGTSSEAFGFVELTGHLEEHTDGIIRAERARILALYIPIFNEHTNAIMALGLLGRLKESYCPVPVYPVTSYQATLIIMREVIINCGVPTY